ncbi:TetR/AcrR family transcriptional regulator [Paenibacillus jilunlii]|uniref:DNA-binding transcriptional regulator, AcrR family n=1 Tax=Paenibacillus jilunlii TaxID=682956 RepID=A0A1G9KL12_9BACL|nr:TetR/AcrR family transcriptional regulator [Paenibacillus jilunlii]KWX69895.1 hypothetical protein AML91_29470 [Paenibacillus jilunlii]SDL50478.1 DNA-binding transcriptional regulator, AcrR family [Paenibacillus jilunlii]
MNQREKLTQLLLKQSLISLLKEKNISQISVKELCTSAGINRSTFYLHYANAYELHTQLEQDIIDNANNYLEKIEANNNAKLYVLAFLDYIKKNDELFSVMLLTTPNNTLFSKRLLNAILMNIDDHLQLSVPKSKKPFIYTYLVNGSLAILQMWIQERFLVPSDEMADLIFSLADHSMLAFKSKD